MDLRLLGLLFGHQRLENTLEGLEGKFDVQVLAVEQIDVCKAGWAWFEDVEGFDVGELPNPATRCISVAVLQSYLVLLAARETEATGKLDVPWRKQGKPGVFLIVLCYLRDRHRQQVDSFLALFGLRDLDNLALGLRLGLVLAGLWGYATAEPAGKGLRLNARLRKGRCGRQDTQTKHHGAPDSL
jgi:hypothetical protein